MWRSFPRFLGCTVADIIVDGCDSSQLPLLMMVSPGFAIMIMRSYLFKLELANNIETANDVGEKRFCRKVEKKRTRAVEDRLRV